MVKLNWYSFGLCKQIGLKKVSIDKTCLVCGLQQSKFSNYEPRHMISNNVVCATSKGYTQSSHLFVCLIYFFTSQSTIFQLRRDGSSCIEPVLN